MCFYASFVGNFMGVTGNKFLFKWNISADTILSEPTLIVFFKKEEIKVGKKKSHESCFNQI